MLRQNLPANAERTSKRLKTLHDGIHNPKLSFRSLVDMLEPDGPSAASSWKSIVDREEQVIVFFQVEYLQFIPQLSKCIRIRRDRTKTFEEILVPSVFFGRYMDDAFVEKAFGTPHLTHFNDLQTLLNVVDQSGKHSQSATTFENNSDGEQYKEDDRIPNEDYEAAFSPLNDDSIPEIPVYPNLVITQINPPSDDSSRNSHEKWEAPQKTQKVPAKLSKTMAQQKYELKALVNEKVLAKEFGMPAPLPVDAEEENIHEPPSDPNVIKVFNSLLVGDKKPYPAPLLDCQMPGPGKVPLTKDGRDGKFLYIEKRDLKNLRRDHGQNQLRYLYKIFDALMGPKGLAFIKRRFEERRRAVDANRANRWSWQISSKKLLSQDFIWLLEEHMTEAGMEISTTELLKTLKIKFDGLHIPNRFDKNFSIPSEEALLREAAGDPDASIEEGVSPSKVFKIPSPPLACEQSSVWKIPLVPKDDQEFPGMYFRIDKIELNLLLKNARQSHYPRKILTALLGEDGLRFLQEWRATYDPWGFLGKAKSVPKAEDIFNKPFVETLRVHLARKHSRRCKLTVNRVPELDYNDLYEVMDNFIAKLPVLSNMHKPSTSKKSSEAEISSYEIKSFAPSKAAKGLNTLLEDLNVPERLAGFQDHSEVEGGQDFTDDYHADADEPASAEPILAKDFDMSQFLVPEPTSVLPESEELLPEYPFPSGLVITEILRPAGSQNDRANNEEDDLPPPNKASSRSVNSDSDASLSEAEDSPSDCESDSEFEIVVKGKKQKSVGKTKVGRPKFPRGVHNKVEPPEDPSKITVFRSVVYGEKVPYPPPELDCQKPGPGKVPLTTKGSKNRHVYIRERELKYLLEKWAQKPAKYLTQLMDELLGSKGWNFVFTRREEKARENQHIKNGTLPRLLTNEFTSILKNHMAENGMPMSVKNLQDHLKSKHDYVALARRNTATAAGPVVSADDRTGVAETGNADNQREKNIASGQKEKKPHKVLVTPEEPPDDPLIFKVFYSVLPGDREVHPPPQLACQVAGPAKIPLTAMGIENRHLYVVRKEQKYLLKICGKRPRRYLGRLLEELMGPEGWNFVFARHGQRKKANPHYRPTSLLQLLTRDFLLCVEGHMKDNGMLLSMEDIRKIIKSRQDYVNCRRKKETRTSRSSHQLSKADDSTDEEEDVQLTDALDEEVSVAADACDDQEDTPVIDAFDEDPLFTGSASADEFETLGKVFTIESPALACEEPGSGKVPLVKIDDEDFPGMVFFLDGSKLEAMEEDYKRRPPKTYPKKVFTALLGVEGLEFLKEWRIENQALFGGKSTFGDKCAEIVFTGGFLETLRVYLVRSKISVGQIEVQKMVNDFVSKVSNIDIALFEAKGSSDKAKSREARSTTPENFAQPERASRHVDVFEYEVIARDQADVQEEQSNTDDHDHETNYESILKPVDEAEDSEPLPVYRSIIKRTFPPRISSRVVQPSSPEIAPPPEVRAGRPKRQSRNTKEVVYREPDSNSEEEPEEDPPSEEEYLAEDTEDDIEEMPQSSSGPEVKNMIPKKSSAGLILDSVLCGHPPVAALLVAPFSVLKIFETGLCGGEQSALPPLLHCQRPGEGKIPLTAESVDGKNLYIDRKELRTHRSECSGSASVYLHRLVSSLFGSDGWNFLVDSEKRRTAYQANSSQSADLLSREFLVLLQRHMRETGLPISAVDIRNGIMHHCKSLIRLGPSS